MGSWNDKIFFSISAMVIVFSVLVFLMTLINIMSVIFKEKTKKKVEVIEESPVDEAAVEYYEEDDECEVVAAIMAALSAKLNVSTDKLVIKKIKRIDRGTNWRN